MNFGPLIFVGVLFTLALSWVGMIAGSVLQLGGQQPAVIEPLNYLYPTARPGMAQAGREVYRANGCYYCHTQQVRHGGAGADIERGWGSRFSVSRDYLHEQPLMLGNLRAGPDLKNLGARLPDANWHLLRLYDPQIVAPGSPMPRYRHLFEKQRIGREPSPDAIELPPAFAAEAGYEIVPKPEARALAAYLMSLQAQTPLFESPMPIEEMEETEAGVDGVVGTTNGAPNAVVP